MLLQDFKIKGHFFFSIGSVFSEEAAVYLISNILSNMQDHGDHKAKEHSAGLLLQLSEGPHCSDQQ